MDFFKNEKCLIFDESGNLGHSGRYFIIACIETNNYKSLYNIMHKKINLIRENNPKLKMHNIEVKAKDTSSSIKIPLLKSISTKDIKIHYIVADLNHIKPSLLKNKNILYNYLTKLLLDKIVYDTDTKINILFDNHTTKVLSTNSLFDYITIHFNYEKDFNCTLNLQYINSDSKSGYCIQAIDFIANSLYAKYEYEYNNYFDIFKSKVVTSIHFPYKFFGS